MYNELNQLIIYRNFDKENILHQLGEVSNVFKDGNDSNHDMVGRIFQEIHHLMEIGFQYGFDHNLWHNYIAWLLANDENPFSILCEKTGEIKGSINQFAFADLKNIYKLFHYDFTSLEEALGISCFSMIKNYSSVKKREPSFSKSVSEIVCRFTRKLEEAVGPEEFYRVVIDFYRDFGVGKFGLNKAFGVKKDNGEAILAPVLNTDTARLQDIIGYDLQKKKLVDNTKAFVEGKRANNVLLFGDSGTGKSTSIKAILNEFYPQGLRMIEIYKHQFQDLNSIIDQIKDRNYRFIIYMDDLSFEEFEIEYKYLKAIIEGGLETRPENVLIYATSNRRHLIRETWGDRNDNSSNEELHRSETMQEKLSLVSRFGVTIRYSKPVQKEFFHIVVNLAKKYPAITLTDEELCQEANKWELSHGGMSGRTAQQFINYLCGK